VRVFKRLGLGLLIAAVLAATGTHWLVLQSVAWTTMLASNLHTTTFTQAVERTFDGRHPCCLCKQIAKSKQSEKQSDLQVEYKKLEFPYTRFVFVFSSPTFFWKTAALTENAVALSRPPPTPPPRTV
jgi:hypothetical protein